MTTDPRRPPRANPRAPPDPREERRATESDRRVVEENIDRAARTRRIQASWCPSATAGGRPTSAPSSRSSREVAKGCGSTAWVTALMNVCAFFVASMNEQAQDDVWGTDPDARIAGVFNPTARPRRSTADTSSTAVELDQRFVLTPIGRSSACRSVNDEGEFVLAGDGVDPQQRARDRGHVVHHRACAAPAATPSTPRGVRTRSPSSLGARPADPRIRHPVQGRGVVPVGVHPGRGVDPRRAATRARPGRARLRDREGSQAGHRLQRVRVATRRPTFQLAISKAATLVDTAHLFAYRAPPTSTMRRRPVGR